MQKVGKQSKSTVVAGFGERMNTAAAAKKAQLEKWRATVIDVNDPAFLEQQAVRQAAAAGRTERERLRKAEKDAAKAKTLADRKAAQEAAALQAVVDKEAREIADREAAEALIALAAQRKAIRDARYAARKAAK